MPAHALSDAQLDALVAFLAWVDSSGQSQVPAEAVHWTGTYLIERH
jgi:cytochrome c1